MSNKQFSMINFYDKMINENFSGEDVIKLKNKVRNNDVVAQERLLEIERAQERIEGNQDDKKYIDEQKFEIKCLIRELEGKPSEGTTDEEKKEYREYHPMLMSDEQIKRAKQEVSQMKIR